MSDDQGWRPLKPPENPAVRPPTTAFTRLARVHALAAAGDAIVTTSLAGSLFFSIPTGQARGKVFLYLLIAMAPFALVAPLIGPAIDRLVGGRRLMVIVSCVGRAMLALLMIGRVNTLVLFPLAFLVLVMQKGYSVAKSALVPTTVRSDDELVQANSKLSLLSGVVGFAGALPGALLFHFGGPSWSLALAVIAYGAASVFGLQLPPSQVAQQQASQEEREELHAPSILLGASGMGLLRGIVGFLAFLLAFNLQGHHRPVWELGVAVAASVLGSLVGAVVAPKLRKVAVEERLLIGALVMTFFVALASATVLDGLTAAALLAFTVGLCASGGKLAFDSIVQRDAPDANRGRSFARFETRFQLLWVVGAAIAVIAMPARVGYAVIVVVAGFAAFAYAVGLLAARQRSGHNPTAATAAAVEIEARMSGVSADARERFSSSMRALGRKVSRRGSPPGPTPGPDPRTP